MTTHIFNVSGDKPELLRQALELAFAYGPGDANGWYISPEEGIVLVLGKAQQLP